MSETPDDDHRGLQGEHQALITDGEVQQIIRALRPFGILDHDALLKECHHDGWQDGGFETALQKAVAAGAIEVLPGGFYKLVQQS